MGNIVTGERILLLIKLVFALLGLVFLCISIGLSRSMVHKQKICTQQVIAYVADVEGIKNRSMDHHIRTESWYPVYEYTVEDETVRVRSKIGGLRSDYQIGQKVELMVNPQNLYEFYNPVDQTGLLQKIFLIVGLVLLVSSVGIAVLGKMALQLHTQL